MWTLVDPNDFTQSIEWPAGFILDEGSAAAPQDRIAEVPQDHVYPEAA